MKDKVRKRGKDGEQAEYIEHTLCTHWKCAILQPWERHGERGRIEVGRKEREKAVDARIASLPYLPNV
jgi:hypothetical protein